MSKKIERLRAVYLNRDSLEQITNLESLGDFSQSDVLFLEEFKKIYHLGVDQLDFFVNLLDKAGDSYFIDPASIIYYIEQLRAGPLASYIPAALEKTPITLGTKWWTNAPEIIGTIKYLYKSTAQTPISELKTTEVVDTTPLLLNKSPQHIVDQYKKMSMLTNSVYSSGINDSLKFDNELRGIPSTTQASNKTPHGSYLVADTSMYPVLEMAQEEIETKIQKALKYLEKEQKQDRYTLLLEERKELTYSLYTYRRSYNYFKDSNTSHKYIINRLSEYEDGGETKQAIIVTDLIGNTYESDKFRRLGSLNIVNEDRNTTLNLHTVRGQLGGLSEPKRDPLVKKDS